MNLFLRICLEELQNVLFLLDFSKPDLEKADKTVELSS